MSRNRIQRVSAERWEQLREDLRGLMLALVKEGDRTTWVRIQDVLRDDIEEWAKLVRKSL